MPIQLPTRIGTAAARCRSFRRDITPKGDKKTKPYRSAHRKGRTEGDGANVTPAGRPRTPADTQLTCALLCCTYCCVRTCVCARGSGGTGPDRGRLRRRELRGVRIGKNRTGPLSAANLGLTSARVEASEIRKEWAVAVVGGVLWPGISIISAALLK